MPQVMSMCAVQTKVVEQRFGTGVLPRKRFYEKVIKLRPEKLLDMTV
jgi:hypothetical protein